MNSNIQIEKLEDKLAISEESIKELQKQLKTPVKANELNEIKTSILEKRQCEGLLNKTSVTQMKMKMIYVDSILEDLKPSVEVGYYRSRVM